MWGALLKLAPTILSSLGALGGGKQKGREAENAAAGDAAAFQLREREGAEAAHMGRANLDLEQRQFGIGSQNNAYQNALRSALAKNMQDVSIQGAEGIPVVNFAGGARPSALGVEGREAAGLMHRKAMESLLNGEKFDQLPPIERTAAPTFKKPGFWENALGLAGMVGRGIEGYQDNQQQQSNTASIIKAIAELNQPKLPGQQMPLPGMPR